MFNLFLSSSIKWYLFNFTGETGIDKAFNSLRSISVWLTLALILAFIVCAITIKKDNKAKFLKISSIFFIVYTCVLGSALLILNLLNDGIENILFYPVLVSLLFIGINALIICFVRNKAIYIESACTIGVSIIATFVCIVYYSIQNADETVKSAPLYISAIICIAAIIVLAFVLGKNDKKGFDTRAITYGAICVATSFTLSYLRIVRLPQGGSITVASLLPVMIYAYIFGIKKGLFVGIIYGLLQAVQGASVVHPAQFLLDYPIAFCCVGLASVFTYVKPLDKMPLVQFTLGAIVAGCGRFIMHFLSGAFAYGAYAPENMNPVLYSFVYQAGYVLPDIALAIGVGILVFASKSFVELINKIRTTSGNKAEQN